MLVWAKAGASIGEEGLGYIRGYCIAEATGSPAGDASDVEIFLTTWVCGSKAIAASSTITDGSLPRVYDAVNSQGRPDFRHNAHGHLPVHLTFFLHGMLVGVLQSTSRARWLSSSSLLTSVTRPTDPTSFFLLSSLFCGRHFAVARACIAWYGCRCGVNAIGRRPRGRPMPRTVARGAPLMWANILHSSRCQKSLVIRRFRTFKRRNQELQGTSDKSCQSSRICRKNCALSRKGYQGNMAVLPHVRSLEVITISI